MVLGTTFAPFVKERPICVMARAVLERLLDAQRLDALFARTAERQYTRELLFSSVVQLMSEVVLGGPSHRPCGLSSQQRGDWGVDHRPVQQARSHRNRRSRRARARLRRVGGTRGQGVAGQSPTV